QGPKGNTGPQGPKGDQGPQGPQGPKGNTGPQGPLGPQGLAGAKGLKGNIGPQGPQGPKGDQGPQGPQGPQGKIGLQGPQGASPFNLAGKNTSYMLGNVGIGTTTPSAKLEVAGDAKFTGGIRADYDSGWVYIDLNGGHVTHTLNHNLGMIPTRITFWIAASDKPTSVYVSNPNSRGASSSPETTWLSNTQMLIGFSGQDDLIYCGGKANPCPPGIVTSKTGYIRVLLWK
ncbi:MAG TPA: hypothetical protein DCM38_00235, partial [Gammaproteobacteria bacterium]|nr:hypothetical protein [Gammaproteobacteria bacterium]